MARHPMLSSEDCNIADYPNRVILHFRTSGEAEDALHELENEVRSVKYNEGEIGLNIYYVDSIDT